MPLHTPFTHLDCAGELLFGKHHLQDHRIRFLHPLEAQFGVQIQCLLLVLSDDSLSRHHVLPFLCKLIGEKCAVECRDDFQSTGALGSVADDPCRIAQSIDHRSVDVFS